MNKWNTVLFFVLWSLECNGREPFRPQEGSTPFVVYFPSRYRGLCVGTLASRTVVLTAAVCVTNPEADIKDTRAINVVCGTTYRHVRRGIRMQVTKILIPNLSDLSGDRGFLMEKSPAVLLLKNKVPDILTEVPMRPITIDYKGDVVLTLHEECFMSGWHFFYAGDTIYPIHKFLLQRNLRVQFMNIVKKDIWCDALAIKFQKTLSDLGFHGYIDKTASICVRDPDKIAQPCHGMYGSALICRGKAVGLMSAPDAQWTNCTGFSNIIHKFDSLWLRSFFTCVSSLFEVDPLDIQDWNTMKRRLVADASHEEYDYVPSIYDKIYEDSSSASEEDGLD